MSHQMTSTDNYGGIKEAWHRLGQLIPADTRPTKAVDLICPFYVLQRPITIAGEEQHIPDRVANIRSDTKEVLGIVSSNYTPVQNHELAEFAEALSSSAPDLVTETVGTLSGGRIVYLLVRGPSIYVGDTPLSSDEVAPYLMLANGHDGTMGFHARWTSIRVVCANTMEMAFRSTANSKTNFRLKHTGKIQDRIEQAKKILGLYEKITHDYETATNKMASIPIDEKDMTAFFTKVWEKVKGRKIPSPDTPSSQITGWDIRAYDQAIEDISKMVTIAGNEANKFGSDLNIWLTVNAATNFIQHTKAESTSEESLLNSNMFGVNRIRTNEIIQLAEKELLHV